jgi:translocator assembly and maintenance protein 41
MNEADREFLESLPTGKLVLAYGSGVFPQLARGRLAIQRTRDYILVVDNPAEWLLQALDRHPEHFAWYLRSLRSRPGALRWLQHLGAGMCFVPPVPLASRSAEALKYGVIAEETLLADIREWRYFYAAGRLQKPVELIILSNMARVEAEACARRVDEANKRHNLVQAVRMGILLGAEADTGPRLLPVATLLEQVVGLSYSADIRMRSGLEHPNKTRNILHANMDRLLGMYTTALAQMQREGLVQRLGAGDRATRPEQALPWRPDDLLDISMLFQTDVYGHRARNRLLGPLLQLPLFCNIQAEDAIRQRLRDQNSAALRKFQGPVVIEYFARALGGLLRRRVLHSSVSQAVKGLITAGPSRSLQYLWGKWWRRWS